MSEEKERESRMFWVVHGDELHHIRGYKCPNIPEYWWFPKIRCSCCEGYHVFETEEEARAKLLEELKDRRNDINQKISELTLLGGDEPEESEIKYESGTYCFSCYQKLVDEVMKRDDYLNIEYYSSTSAVCKECGGDGLFNVIEIKKKISELEGES